MKPGDLVRCVRQHSCLTEGAVYVVAYVTDWMCAFSGDVDWSKTQNMGAEPVWPRLLTFIMREPKVIVYSADTAAAPHPGPYLFDADRFAPA